MGMRYMSNKKNGEYNQLDQQQVHVIHVGSPFLGGILKRMELICRFIHTFGRIFPSGNVSTKGVTSKVEARDPLGPTWRRGMKNDCNFTKPSRIWLPGYPLVI